MNEEPVQLPLQGRNGFIFALGLALIVGFAFQGSRGLWEPTEARYAECARQMAEHGSLLKPILNGHGHWTKPPLAYWSIIAGCKVLGWNAWGARLYLVVAFAIATLAVYFTAIELWGRRYAGICAVVYATSPYVFSGAFAVSTDMLLASFVTVAGMFFWRGVRHRRPLEFTLMWAAFALAFMTKGPPSLLMLAGIIPTYIFLKRTNRDLPPLIDLKGAATFLVVGLTWYVYATLTNNGLLSYWFTKEVVQRNVSGVADRNPEFYNAFMYPPLVLLGAGFWSLWLILSARQIPWPKGAWRRPLEWANGIEWTYILCATIPPMIVFMLIKSRLYLYTLPLMAPAALATGRGIAYLAERGKISGTAITRVAVLSAIALIAMKFNLSHAPGADRDMKKLGDLTKAQLEPFPNTSFYFGGDDLLNGLQFYLRREMLKLPEYEPPFDEAHYKQIEQLLNDDAVAQRTSIFFARNKDFDKIAGAIRHLRTRNIYAPRFRILVRPLDIKYGFIAVFPLNPSAKPAAAPTTKPANGKKGPR